MDNDEIAGDWQQINILIFLNITPEVLYYKKFKQKEISLLLRKN